MRFSENAAVIVVHGAWADGSSWQAIVRPLEDRGLKVIAAPIPRAAPVTSATFPSRLFIFFSSNWLRHISTHKPPTQSLSRFVSIATSSGSPDP